MIKNFLKTAVRSLLKNKGFTALNVFGLVLGLAAFLLIAFYVFDELSYDRFNEKASRIYRLDEDIKFGGNTNSYAVAPSPASAALKNDFPDIEEVARFRSRGGNQVKKGLQNIQEDRMLYADNSIFKVFTLPMVSGNPATALTETHTVVITEKMARKYFDQGNALGKVLVLNDTSLYKVTGVIKDIPRQSHFNYDFFLAMPTLEESRQDSWFSSNFNTYILLRPGADPRKLEASLPDFLHRHAAPQLESILHLSFEKLEQGGDYFHLNLMPLLNIHLHSNSVAELGANGNIQYVYIFSAIAIFILLIACVNFMNLSTARSANRAREVGVRKVLGSPRQYLVAQFLTESILITLLGAILAVLAAWTLLPLFNQMSGKELHLTASMLVWILPLMLALVLFIGLLAGSYPALFLSRFQPIQVLKGKLAAGFKGGRLRSFLVVFQFSISIFLIIGTLVIYNQLQYIQNKDLGYNRNQVLIIQNVWTLGNSAQTFKQEVKNLAGVQNATLTGALPTSDYGNSGAVFKDPVLDQKKAMLSQEWNVDADYLGTLGIKLISGRNFSKEMLTDSTAIIINEAAANLLNFPDPLNQLIYIPADNYGKTLIKLHIIGVMKNFNFRSLRDNVTPLIFLNTEDRGALSVRISTQNLPGLLEQIKNKFKAFAPNQEFNYSFMEKDFDALYRSEQRIGTIFLAFTSLAILIACLGLFGLAAYAAEQRTKEIGIRKVLGAGVPNIVGMLSINFIKLVFIAILIATPLAWWAMQKWLQGFAYRQDIKWWIVPAAGLGALLISFLTISFQSIRAALTDPVKNLRTE